MKRLVPILSFLISVSASGQVPHFTLVELLRKKESVQVNVIFPDRVGYLWIGTNKGLIRFDGLQNIQFKKSDGLADDNITAIAQDSLGRIWCGHKTGELSYLEKNEIKKFEPREGSATGLISDILFDRSGTMWFSTHNDGLYYYKNDRLYRIDEAEGLPDLFFYDIEEDHKGNIWAGSDGGIAICSFQSDNTLRVNVISTQDGLPDNIIHKIHQDSDSTFWLGTEDSGMVHYLPDENKFEQHSTLSLKQVNDFVIEENSIWIATRDPGIVVYDKELKTMTRFNEDLPATDVVAKDAEGNVWLGSKKGLQRSYGNHISFLDLKDVLDDDNVFAVAPDANDNVWFSTQSGLFVRHKDEAGNFVIEKPLKGTSYEKLFFISLYADSRGYVWAGSYGQGLLRIQLASKKVTYFSKELRNGNILGITGKDSTVWLATLGGITKITEKRGKLEFESKGSAEGLASDYIYQVFIDSKERVWLATDGKGIDMIDEKGIHHSGGGLGSKVVYGFAEDRHHMIWANVQNEGLYYLDRAMFKPGYDTTLIDYHNNDVACFSSTREGNLIIAHDFGLEVLAVEGKHRYYLGTEKDFQDRHPNLNATAEDIHGNIYFGTEGGIVIYKGGLTHLPSSPVPHIENLKISNDLIDITDPLILDHSQNSIIFNYVGFWFQNPEVVSFKYQLENYDHEWIASGDHTATYSNLPPGDYTFRLKVSNDDMFLSEVEDVVHFVIRPPFWRTYWFYGLVTIAMLASGYTFIHNREERLIADKHALEEKVNERTAEIMKMNYEIKHQAEEIKAINDNLERLVKARTQELNRKNRALQEAAFINAHNLRSPVASLLGLINLVKKLNWPEQDKEFIQHLDQSANRLDEVVKTISEAIDRGDDTHLPREE